MLSLRHVENDIIALNKLNNQFHTNWQSNYNACATQCLQWFIPFWINSSTKEKNKAILNIDAVFLFLKVSTTIIILFIFEKEI